jgi:hypothetical protein
MLEPAPLLIGLTALVTLLAGRLMPSRASLPVALVAATLGALLGEAVGAGLFGGLIPVAGTAWPAPLLGALLAERFAARIAVDWRRGQQP